MSGGELEPMDPPNGAPGAPGALDSLPVMGPQTLDPPGARVEALGGPQPPSASVARSPEFRTLGRAGGDGRAGFKNEGRPNPELNNAPMEEPDGAMGELEPPREGGPPSGIPCSLKSREGLVTGELETPMTCFDDMLKKEC